MALLNKILVCVGLLGTVNGLSTRAAGQGVTADGCKRAQTYYDEELDSLTASHAVRCCSNNGNSCVSKISNQCYASNTFLEASQLCTSIGRRLCSIEELNSEICCSTGCNHDNKRVWTSDSSLPQETAVTYNRFKTMFTGDNKCLDIINDANDNKLIMASCGGYSGQHWNIEATNRNGYYRLKTMFTGDNKCLDVINDASDNKVIMSTCGNYSGQFWKIEETNRAGYFRLKTMFTGDDKCLDIINDSSDNKLILATCGNYSGQYWKKP
eukprot:Awhi_evm1s776